MEEARGPRSESGEADEAASETEKGCEAPKEVGEHGEAPAAAEKETQPDSRGQEAGEPCRGAGGGAEALEPEPGGPRAPAPGSRAERPLVPENQEGPALPEGSGGSPSGALAQVRAAALVWGAMGSRGEPGGRGGMGVTCSWGRARWGQEMDRELASGGRLRGRDGHFILDQQGSRGLPHTCAGGRCSTGCGRPQAGRCPLVAELTCHMEVLSLGWAEAAG